MPIFTQHHRPHRVTRRGAPSGVAGATTVYAYPPDSHRLDNIGGTERTFDAAGNGGAKHSPSHDSNPGRYLPMGSCG